MRKENLATYYNLNWASEASPTLGCSIEISHDICMYVCMSLIVYGKTIVC